MNASVEAVITPRKTILSCCNCSSACDSAWFNLDESIACHSFDVTAKELKATKQKILDILINLYKFTPTAITEFENLPEKLIMCIKCVDSLCQLHQLYHEFMSLSVFTNSSLARAFKAGSLVKATSEKDAVEGEITSTSVKVIKARRDRRQARSSKTNSKPEVPAERKTREEPKITKSDVNLIVIVNDDIKGKERGDPNPSEQRAIFISEELPLPQPNATTGPNTSVDNVNGSLTGAEKSKLADSNQNSKNEAGDVKCDRCDRSFGSSTALKIHYASHSREEQFPCKECYKCFKTQRALESHKQVDHGGVKPFKCSVEGCGKQFRLKKKLLLHVKVIHDKCKPYPCPKCEKSFRTRYDLKVHDVGKHVQGDSSIGCSKCRRKFPSREDLEKHVRTHDEDKPFVCTDCRKGFQTNTRLKLHMKSHEDLPSYICTVCGKSYKHKRDLIVHEVIHQDESTFRFGCGDCPRRFYRIDLLRNHQSNESHFSPEVVGPTYSKLSTPKSPAKKQRKKNDETNNPTLQKKRKKWNSKTKQKPKRKTDCSDVSEYPTLLTANSDDNDKPSQTVKAVEVNNFSSAGGPSLLNDDVPPQVPILLNTTPNYQTSCEIGSMADSNMTQLASSPVDLSDKSFVSTFDISAGAEQIGIDVINAFINNLN